MTSDVSAETSEVSPGTVRNTADTSTRTSKSSQEAMLTVSRSLDATLEDTTRLTWDTQETVRLDPDVADELIKQAYAFSGTELSTFARELGVPDKVLAIAIIRSVPDAPTRTQLQRLMTLVVPELRRLYGS